MDLTGFIVWQSTPFFNPDLASTHFVFSAMRAQFRSRQPCILDQLFDRSLRYDEVQYSTVECSTSDLNLALVRGLCAMCF